MDDRVVGSRRIGRRVLDRRGGADRRWRRRQRSNSSSGVAATSPVVRRAARPRQRARPPARNVRRSLRRRRRSPSRTTPRAAPRSGSGGARAAHRPAADHRDGRGQPAGAPRAGAGRADQASVAGYLARRARWPAATARADPRRTGSVTLRVPQPKFSQLMSQLPTCRRRRVQQQLDQGRHQPVRRPQREVEGADRDPGHVPHDADEGHRRSATRSRSSSGSTGSSSRSSSCRASRTCWRVRATWQLSTST